MAGYGGSGIAPRAGNPRISWTALKKGNPIAKGALRAGWTQSDGPTYIGRHRDNGMYEVGKINVDEGDGHFGSSSTMCSFWCHGLWRRKTEAEILSIDDSVVPTWRSLSRGEKVPSTALILEGELENLDIISKEAMNLLSKIRIGEKQGSICVGRFNGEPGTLEARGGSMHSFWGHACGERTSCEILCFEPPSQPAVATTEPVVQLKGALNLAAASAPAVAVQAVVNNSLSGLAPMKLKVLQFNIWQEGWEMGSAGTKMIADVIAASGADIVALSEVRNWTANNMPMPFSDFHTRLKDELKTKGLIFHGSWVAGCDVGFVSKFPLEFAEPVTEAKRSFIAAYHIRTPLGPLCVCSAHLDWKAYALNLVRGYDAYTFRKLSQPVTDTTKLHAMDAESSRNEALSELTKYAKTLNYPVLLAGDFNECSHLDWTDATKDTYGHAGVAIDWKQSKHLKANGFIDSFRELYPDPATHMGCTWPSVAQGKECTSWAKESDERDRIDFIYYNSDRFKPTAAHIVGPRQYFIKGKPADPTCQTPFLPATLELPWPTDHKAIMVDFDFAPAS